MSNPRRRNPAPADPYEAAVARWAKIQGEVAGRQHEIDGIRMALSLAGAPADRHRVPAHLQSLAEPCLDDAERRPDKLRRRLAKVEDEAERARPHVDAARQEFELAQRQETNRRALELQPDHRRAVEGIARALHDLSDAIEAERAARRGLRPLRQSKHLPDVTTELGIDTLNDPNSTTRRWLTKARQLGILES